MNNSQPENKYHRSPGAFRATWVTVLVLTLGLLGAGSSWAAQAANAVSSGEADGLFGAPSSTAITALLSASRAASDGVDDEGDLPAIVPSALPGQSSLPAVAAVKFVFHYLVSRYLGGSSPRAPPLV